MCGPPLSGQRRRKPDEDNCKNSMRYVRAEVGRVSNNSTLGQLLNSSRSGLADPTWLSNISHEREKFNAYPQKYLAVLVFYMGSDCVKGIYI